MPEETTNQANTDNQTTSTNDQASGTNHQNTNNSDLTDTLSIPSPTEHQPNSTTTKPSTTPSPMSSPIMNAPVQKPMNKLLPVVIILTVLTLAGIGTSIFAFVQSSDQKSEIAHLKNQLSGQNITPTTPDSTTPNEPTDSNNNQNNSEEIAPAIRAKVLASVPSNLVIGDKNPLNVESDTQHSFGDSISSNDGTIVSATLNLWTNTVILNINWDQAKSAYQFQDFQIPDSKSGTESFDNLGLSGKPTDIILAKFGQAFGDETLCILMEDGTVEYIPIAKALKDNNIRSYGKLPNVENVIKFYKGSSCPKEGYTGCGNDTIAQRADGNYYELYQAIGSTGNLLNYHD